MMIPPPCPSEARFIFIFYFENYDRKFSVLYGVCCICATVSQQRRTLFYYHASLNTGDGFHSHLKRGPQFTVRT